jgi:hypothetical protein
MENNKTYAVGTIVKLNMPIISKMDGTKGIIVGHVKDEITNETRCNVLFENSLRDSFPVNEQSKYLQKIGFANNHSHYHYKNEEQIDDDWKSGLWKDVF